ACAALADLIDGLARERVGAEMRKLLAAPDPAPAVAAMAASGVLARCLPGAETAALAPLVAREQIAGVAPDWRTRLAAITPGMAVETLRLTNAEVRHLSSIAKALEAPHRPAALAASHGAEVAEAALVLKTALEPTPWSPLASEIARGARAELPLTAGDLVAAGLAEGPMLGAALSRARTAWLDSDLTLDKAALMREALDRSL
ncbi:MAG: CCA tRNA nucleotidyltransferase, partial [Pseudomonadota bacterium]